MLKTVLVCDDAVFMRTMLADILTQAGFAEAYTVGALLLAGFVGAIWWFERNVPTGA